MITSSLKEAWPLILILLLVVVFIPFSFFPPCSVCPKWAKVQKQHTEKGAVVLLIVCSSALRTIELIKWVPGLVYLHVIG